MTKTAEYALLLILMIYFHIIDDFYLQGILAKLKQKEWWETTFPGNKMYDCDYIIALLLHAFSWAVTVHIPVLFIYHAYSLPLFLGAFALHAIIDDLKANKEIFGLAIDQILHIVQIEFLWMIYITVYGGLNV